MHTDTCQRWRDRREYRVPVERRYDVRHLEIVSTKETAVARAFVEQHHYSHAWPAARRKYLVYEGDTLVGCAIYGQPCNALTLSRLPDPSGAIELQRLVLLDRIGANAETYVIARCHELLRSDGFSGVVTFADPTARHDASGNAVFAGHIGTIYQASNAIYTGRATARTLHLLPDGTVYSSQSIGKIQRMIQGWQYATRELEAHGAAPYDASWDRAQRDAWLKESLGSICTRMRHGGNLTYLIGLDRACKRALAKRYGTGLPYLKMGHMHP
jgi:hypothetical protein